MTQRPTRAQINRFGVIFLLIMSWLLLIGTNPAMALSSDREQPANIEADNIEFDLRKGTRTFTDNVLAVQGTLRLKADKLVANYENNQLVGAKAWGSLARFKQRPDNEPNDVEGWARRIVVDQAKNTLTLIGDAALRQGMDTMRGQKIVYNMANNTLKVSGGAAVGVSNNRSNNPSDNEGSTAKGDPNKKIEDPFKDDPDLPPEPARVASATDESTGNGEENEEGEKTEPVEEPITSRRSRLIIQPRKKSD